MGNCRRLWLGSSEAINATRLFRRVFQVAPSALRRADLHIFADAKYQLWVNGCYLGRGPAFFHPHRRPVDHYDVGPCLVAGKNVIAVLVHAPGIALHNYIPADLPGLVARLDLHFVGGRHLVLFSDSRWKATDQTGWSDDTPRRNWAIGFVESYDFNRAPCGWQSPAFDDTHWPAAEEHAPFAPGQVGKFFPSALPRLKFAWMPVVKILRFAATSVALHRLSGMDDCAKYGAMLVAERLCKPRRVVLSGQLDAQGGGLVVKGLTLSEGAFICCDLGCEAVGGFAFACQSDSAGVIDLGWSEAQRAGRPLILRKNSTYADRIIIRKGPNDWQPLNFSAGRYLCIVLRGFTGSVRFNKLGLLASEPALKWEGHFSCANRRLNAVWSLCARTVRVGTQEGLMDCPTREQATYVGDGNPTAMWLARLTGDYAYWRALIKETFAAQSPDGQIKSVVFSGMQHILLDYSLLAVLAVRDYLHATGDTELVRQVLPKCRKLLDWFAQRLDRDGLFTFAFEKLSRHAGFVSAPAQAVDPLRFPGYSLFIDHPGMGWHNLKDAGIDRRGCNAAMHALFCATCRGFNEMATVIGARRLPARQFEPTRLRSQKIFWDPKKRVFVDGVLEGQRLGQVSQQTNAWCMLAGFKVPGGARNLWRRLLREKSAKLARSGPYFWSYMLPELARVGLHRDALAAVENLWGGMLARGATTAWETFAGDHLDSFCHPWSCAPLDFLLRYVAGIGNLPRNAKTIVLSPRPDLLKDVKARVVFPQGAVCVAWTRRNKALLISGRLPSGIMGRLCLPQSKSLLVKGSWRINASVV